MESHRATGPNHKEANHHLHLQHEIRALMATLTRHLTDLNRPRPSHSQDPAGHDGDDQGLKIVTLSGTNRGSVVQADMDELAGDGNHGIVYGSDENVFAFANSNYQAVNNSVMMGGSYRAEDPGVHLDMSEYVELYGGEDAESGIEEEEKKKIIEEVQEDVNRVFNKDKASKVDVDEEKSPQSFSPKNT